MTRIFSTAILLSIILFVPLAQAAPVQGPNGNYYERMDTLTLWTEARDAAALMSFQGESGHLATILDASTQNFIHQSLRVGAPGDCWFGATDTAIEGDWRWVTGELFWQGNWTGSIQNGLYENWNSNEPNDASGNEDGAQMYSSGVWNDYFNTSRVACYFVEYPGSLGSTTTIPALSVWGLLLMLSVLGLYGVVAIRRMN